LVQEREDEVVNHLVGDRFACLQRPVQAGTGSVDRGNPRSRAAAGDGVEGELAFQDAAVTELPFRNELHGRAFRECC